MSGPADKMQIKDETEVVLGVMPKTSTLPQIYSLDIEIDNICQVMRTGLYLDSVHVYVTRGFQHLVANECAKLKITIKKEKQ